MFLSAVAAFSIFGLSAAPAYAVLPNIFATQPTGNVAASTLDTNFTFLEVQGVQALTTTGAGNAYIATPADAWVTGYSSYTARALTVKPNFTNSGAATINISGLGTASIYKNVAGVATALASGDITSALPAILICDGTNFLLANPTSTSGIVTIKKQLFTANGTYTPCTGLIYNDVTAIASGGSGGAAAGGAWAGGGGAGEERQCTFSSSTIGSSQTVTIGAAVAGPAAGNTDGTNGNNTSLGALCIANGGSFGHKGSDGSGGAGGTGGTGGISITGQLGKPGNASGGTGPGGAGGNSMLGSSMPPTAVAANVTDSVGFGAGGTGAFGSGAGGKSAPGIIIITEYCSQ